MTNLAPGFGKQPCRQYSYCAFPWACCFWELSISWHQFGHWRGVAVAVWWFFPAGVRWGRLGAMSRSGGAAIDLLFGSSLVQNSNAAACFLPPSTLMLGAQGGGKRSSSLFSSFPTHFHARWEDGEPQPRTWKEAYVSGGPFLWFFLFFFFFFFPS